MQKVGPHRREKAQNMLEVQFMQEELQQVLLLKEN